MTLHRDSIEIEDKAGAYSVFLDARGGDHIATRQAASPKGEISTTPGYRTWPWPRAVRRAGHGFLRQK